MEERNGVLREVSHGYVYPQDSQRHPNHTTTFNPLSDSGVDVDTFAFLTRPSHIRRFCPQIKLTCLHRKCGILFMDKCTLQITNDPFILSIPMTDGLKERMILELLLAGFVVFPSNSPFTLHSGTLSIPLQVFNDILNRLNISDVFVAGYGLKLPVSAFKVLTAGCESLWDDSFRARFADNLPAWLPGLRAAKQHLQTANNMYHVGALFYNEEGLIPTFNLAKGSFPSQHRRNYHVLGSNTILTTGSDHVRTFGGFTASMHDSVREGVLKYQVYLGPNMKFLRSGTSYRVPHHLTSNIANNRLFQKLLETYELMRTCLVVHEHCLSGFRIELTIRANRFGKSVTQLKDVHLKS